MLYKTFAALISDISPLAMKTGWCNQSDETKLKSGSYTMGYVSVFSVFEKYPVAHENYVLHI